MRTEQKEKLYGVSSAELMRWCGVNRSTAFRWKTGRARMPAAALALVELRVNGELGELLGAAWAGWRLGRDGLLYAPQWRRGFTPGELAALPYLHGELAGLRAELRQRQPLELAQAA